MNIQHDEPAGGSRSHRHRLSASAGETPPNDAFKEALLRHPVRARIFELVDSVPGINAHQMSKRLSEHTSLIKFHADRLKRAGLLVPRPSEKGCEILCFTPATVGLWERPETRVLFGRNTARWIGLFVAENAPTETRVVGEAVSRSLATVRHHLRVLREKSLVRREWNGRKALYLPERVLERWAVDLGRRYRRPWIDDTRAQRRPG